MIIKEYLLLNSKVFVHDGKFAKFKHLHHDFLDFYAPATSIFIFGTRRDVYARMRAYSKLLVEAV